VVVAASALEVRAVGEESFEEIYPLLTLFNNAKMTRDDWREMLFSYRWWGGSARGYALFADDKPVGFMGTIFSKRHIRGREEILCNASSWIVRDEYRTASMLLMKSLIAVPNCTIVNLTPTQRAYDIFKKLGFRDLESEQLLLLPVSTPTRLLQRSFTADPNKVLPELTQPDRTIFNQLSSNPRIHHILLRGGSRPCYLIATRLFVKRVPFAELHYISDPDFFWENRALAYMACARTMGVFGIAVDRRFAGQRSIGFAMRRSAKRVYRPAHDDLPPSAVDGLFTELMTVKI
jgi:hypothetical protein